jgi:GSCFA family/Polysaccharide biosynthesis enzyme WcbI
LKLKILIIGNCQAKSMPKLIEAMCIGVEVAYVRLLPAIIAKLKSGELDILTLKAGETDISSIIANTDLILLQSSGANTTSIIDLLEQKFPQVSSKIRQFPSITFTAFHPDIIHLGNSLASPTGPYHSSIACYGWANGFTIEETISLFCEDVYQVLGFFDYWESSTKSLVAQGNVAGLPLDRLINTWTRQGVWMHTINHPKLFVLADLAREILVNEGLTCLPDVEYAMEDRLAEGVSWTAYPEIACRLGVEGKYQFKRGGGAAQNPSVLKFGLEDFVRASFEKYATYRKEDFDCPRLASSRYQELGSFLKRRQQSKSAVSASAIASKSESSSHSGRNPYQGLPDYQFWRRAVERLPMKDVDPVAQPRFALGRNDKVATAGSCFAQHISRTLQKNGFNYYVSENGNNLLQEEAQQRNYGVFSARYGNLYTTRQLLQLFDRVYGNFIPADNYWVREDGKLVDPFRPQIEPQGFANIEELEESRAEHFVAVREMFETLDVFVFTLGLTEAWRSRIDGAVYPLAPGVVAGEMDTTTHEFVNFGVSEVVIDMQLFIKKLLSVNSRAKIILTVSPVPLIATYEDRHVLVSNTYSKSVLRVAAQEIVQRNPLCDYFPSYEIITGNHTKGSYFESDLRSVKTEGVDHVMRLFLAHYASEKQGNSFDQDLMLENMLVSEVVCDEEAIDAD